MNKLELSERLNEQNSRHLRYWMPSRNQNLRLSIQSWIDAWIKWQIKRKSCLRNTPWTLIFIEEHHRNEKESDGKRVSEWVSWRIITQKAVHCQKDSPRKRIKQTLCQYFQSHCFLAVFLVVFSFYYTSIQRGKNFHLISWL